MNPEDRDRVMLRLMAAWPRPPMPDSTTLVWNEHLDKMDGPRALAALATLEKSSRHRPALADFHEAYAEQKSSDPRALAPPACGMCVNGWVDVRCDDPGCMQPEHTASMRCPNGCLPMTYEQRAVKEEQERWQDRKDRGRRHVAAGLVPIDFNEPGARPRHDDEPF